MTNKMPYLLIAFGLLAASLYLGSRTPESTPLQTPSAAAPHSAERPLMRPTHATSDVVIVFREEPVDVLINELEQGLGVLQVHFGPDALALTEPMETLIVELNASFRDDMHTPYDALSPSQQDLYDGVVVLVADLRDLMADIDTLMSPTSNAVLSS